FELGGERCPVQHHRRGQGSDSCRGGDRTDCARRHERDDHGSGRVKGKRISKSTAIALIVGGDLLLLVVGWFMLVSPQRSTAQSIARSAQAYEVQVEQAKAPAKSTTVTQPKQPEIRTAYLYKLSKAMPMTTDMPNLLLELSQVVQSAGVKLNSISPTPPDVTGTTGITLTVSGDFYSLTDLLYRLRNLVTVRD